MFKITVSVYPLSGVLVVHNVGKVGISKAFLPTVRPATTLIRLDLIYGASFLASLQLTTLIVCISLMNMYVSLIYFGCYHGYWLHYIAFCSVIMMGFVCCDMR